MKKIYINPEIAGIELETSTLMTVTSGEQGSAGVGSGTAGDGLLAGYAVHILHMGTEQHGP